MEIVILEHAQQRMVERGISQNEIIDTLNEQNLVAGHTGRRIKEKVFAYNEKWLGVEYPEKRVKVVYIEEDNKIVVLTVIASYGKWR